MLGSSNFLFLVMIVIWLSSLMKLGPLLLGVAYVF